MRIYYLQHVPFEGIGYMEYWLKEKGHVLTGIRMYDDEVLFPTVNDFDALIVMGGPMGVHDQNKYSWLNQEKRLISDAIAAGKRLLGICLGSQLIAHCLGADVSPMGYREIGWFPVTPTPESLQLPWFEELFHNNPTVFHWHGDRFDIPIDAVSLLSSEANANQAFCYDDRVIGLQFHLEVTPQLLASMLEGGSDELTESKYVQAFEKILSGKGYITNCNQIMSAILEHWLEEDLHK